MKAEIEAKAGEVARFGPFLTPWLTGGPFQLVGLAYAARPRRSAPPRRHRRAGHRHAGGALRRATLRAARHAHARRRLRPNPGARRRRAAAVRAARRGSRPGAGPATWHRRLRPAAAPAQPRRARQGRADRRVDAGEPVVRSGARVPEARRDRSAGRGPGSQPGQALQQFQRRHDLLALDAAADQLAVARADRSGPRLRRRAEPDERRHGRLRRELRPPARARHAGRAQGAQPAPGDGPLRSRPAPGLRGAGPQVRRLRSVVHRARWADLAQPLRARDRRPQPRPLRPGRARQPGPAQLPAAAPEDAVRSPRRPRRAVAGLRARLQLHPAVQQVHVRHRQGAALRRRGAWLREGRAERRAAAGHLHRARLHRRAPRQRRPPAGRHGQRPGAGQADRQGPRRLADLRDARCWSSPTTSTAGSSITCSPPTTRRRSGAG